jgi:PLP dependent protein|tara:strand:+ start:228 stop:872 length:645 start_codon:yes stop_codon:yes gene_type:complete
MIAENLKFIQKKITEGVFLVAVSKTKTQEDILETYAAGQRIFGENKAQELAEKAATLPKDIQWHMIGHLQTKKVKYIAPFVSLIHGVDSLKLLQEINKRAQQNNRTIDCLLQLHIAQESTKFGLNEEEVKSVLEAAKELDHIRIIGLMGMATFTSDEAQIRKEFSGLKSSFDRLQKDKPLLQTLSMGMSGDYQIAMEEGSTMVRVGSAIFGSRQ